MNVFKPELQAFAVRAILDEAALALGADEVVQQLATHDLVRTDLDDPSAWLSLEFIEALLDGFVKRGGDAAFIERAASNGVTPKSLGSLYPLLFAFGSPAFTYKQLSRLAGRINKTGTWEYQDSRHGSIRTLWIPNPEASQEHKPYLCNFRSVQLVRVPTLFDLPPAVVKHPQCLLRGDPVCAYDISWDEPPSRRHAQVGAVAGSGLAVLFGALDGSALWLRLSIAAGFALGGWATGRVIMLRQDLRRRIGDIEEHNQALDRVTRANEQRFAELLEAKAEVDVRVERRTRELSDATQQLSNALDKLQALDRAKTDFFNNVSHELRSPLTLILAPLEELLAGRISPGSERNAYQTMHRNGSRLLRLINQLLDLAKIDAGEMKIAPAPTDLASLLRSAVQTFESVAQKKGVQLQLKHPATMSPVIVDAAWIESAITNLLANALRLTNPGGGVRVDVEDLGTEVSVSVSDDGPGIAPADQVRVFERFAQGDSAKRVVGGTGIGLALVREAARLHGGDVELVSELGHGATFKMRLPRRDILPSDGQASQISLPPKALLVEEIQDVPNNDDRPGPASNAPLALVVEDNPELRSFIADVLASRYRVRAAGNGREGLEMARALMPEIVVSDVAMPEMDGYDLCRALREDQATSMIPVLLVTARTDVNSILRGFDAGARDYLLKPFHATELLARVDVHVQLRRLIGRLARQERLAALGSLAASVAHNVRNPLSALISGLPAIRTRFDASLDASTRELMDIMLVCAERIERMTLDLLDLSRIDREASGDFAPGAGLLACVRMLSARLAGGDIEFRTDADDKSLSAGRAGDVNHVFMNVFDNALHAVGNHGVIEVSGRTDGTHYVVTVADSGAGIEPHLLDRVFEPFWTTRSAGEGTGLGLSIARQIMEEHAGSITAARSPLGGAVFTIRLPLKIMQKAVA